VEVLHIAQEALQNVQKHAQASEVNISLRSQNGALILDIVDNGVSITPASLQRSVGNGLANMQDRAASLKGEIKINPSLGGGTEVHLKVPLELNNPS
jgi:two-component system nitrate/nitrite sensor histidine kinase NarX